MNTALPLWNGQLQLGNQLRRPLCGRRLEVHASTRRSVNRVVFALPLLLEGLLRLCRLCQKNNRLPSLRPAAVDIATGLGVSTARTPMYSCVCTSMAGFIQQLAVSYVSNGYFFYVLGVVPDGKDPARVDAKLIDKFNIDVSKWSRARRKRSGIASIQYLRFGRLFALLATHGEHTFFESEGDRVRDLRRVPLKAFGYAVSYKRGHAHVRIEKEEMKRLSAFLLSNAVHRQASWLESVFLSLPYEPYAPVRRQFLQLLRKVNRARRLAGYQPLSIECLRLRRRIVRPFEAESGSVHALVGGRWGEFERGGGASSSPSHQPGSAG